MRRPLPFVRSPQLVAERMLELASAKPNETVCDLGCGDGSILGVAAKKFDAKAVGVELRPQLAAKAENLMKTLGVFDRARIINSDFHRVSVRDADVVALYLTPDALALLRPKLERELKPTARVVSHNYPIRGFPPYIMEKTEGHIVYVYRKPDLKSPGASLIH